MVEQLQTPEKQKKGAPIHIILGMHGEDEYIPQLTHLDKAITETLQKKTSGKAVVFVEDTDASEERAQLIEKFLESGMSPSMSFANAFFVEIYGDLTVFNNHYRRERRMGILGSLNNFQQKRFEILDKHFNTSGRIRLLWESRNDQPKALTICLSERQKAAFAEVFYSVIDGNFGQGEEIYKKTVEDAAKRYNTRENIFASRISKVALDQNVIGVVGFIGGAHTRLVHLLSQKGHAV